MRWILYIVLGILGLNLLVIIMVGVVLLSDWLRGRGRKARTVPIDSRNRSTRGGDPTGEGPSS